MLLSTSKWHNYCEEQFKLKSSSPVCFIYDIFCIPLSPDHLHLNQAATRQLRSALVTQPRTKAKPEPLLLLPVGPPTPPRSPHGTPLMMTTSPTSLLQSSKQRTKSPVVRFFFLFIGFTVLTITN